MIVEFGGVPGVGKTTIACGLSRRLQAIGVAAQVTSLHRPRRSARGLVREALAAVRFALAHPMRAAAIARWALGGGEWPSGSWGRLRVLRLWLRIAAVLSAARHAPGVVLLDQGLFQALVSCLWRGVPVSHCTRVVRQVTLPDVVVVLGAERSVILERLGARGCDRVIDQLIDQNRDVVQGLECATRVATELVRGLGVPVIEIQNDGPVESVVAMLADAGSMRGAQAYESSIRQRA